mgnify:CR=1 FL=1
MHMMTPGTNNSYHYPMYHDDGSFATSGKTATGRGIMVPPPMPPPSAFEPAEGEPKEVDDDLPF